MQVSINLPRICKQIHRKLNRNQPFGLHFSDICDISALELDIWPIIRPQAALWGQILASRSPFGHFKPMNSIFDLIWASNSLQALFSLRLRPSEAWPYIVVTFGHSWLRHEPPYRSFGDDIPVSEPRILGGVPPPIPPY